MPRVRVRVALPEELYARLLRVASSLGVDPDVLVEEGIRRLLRRGRGLKPGLVGQGAHPVRGAGQGGGGSSRDRHSGSPRRPGGW